MPDLVAVRAPTARMFIKAWDQVAANGGAILPIDPSAPDAAIARLVRRTRPTALLTTAPGRPDQLRTIRLPGAEPVKQGTAAVLATSGATGEPKAVVITETALSASTNASLERLGCARTDKWLLALPWHHIAGIAVILRSRATGGIPRTIDRFTTQSITAAVESGLVQWTSLVPTQLHRLLEDGVDLSPLKGVLLGGAAADPALLERAQDAGVRVVTSYGMTETCGGCVYDGVPLKGTQVEIHQGGRIHLSGPTLALGYRLDDPATRETFSDGGFLTNDLGRIGEDGRLEVLGRADDVIVSGGENVPAGEVQRRLCEHPDILDVCVIGLPDEDWGQMVAAAVSVRTGASVDLDILRDHVAATHARAWAPHRLVTVEALPTTALGKPDRRAIRELFE